MMVEEFMRRAEVVEKTRDLQPHELANLRILRRTVQKYGHVARIDELLLGWLGVPTSGYVTWPKVKIAKPKAVQQALF